MNLFLAITFCCITINVGMNIVEKRQLNEDMSSESENLGDIAYVKFLSKPRHRRDLSKSDYHILEINVPAQQKNFTVHLTKETAFVSPDFSTTIHSEDGKQEPKIKAKDKSHECLYTGVVTDTGNGEGTAHLSACDKLAPGFSGVIEVDQKHFLIQPAAADSASTNISTLMHHPNIMHVIKDTTNLTNSDSKISDSIVVPQNLVEEAVAQMAKERNLGESSATNDIENNFQGNLMDLEGHNNGNSITSQMKPLANKPATSSKSNGKKILDLAIFCDASLYQYFKKTHSKDATKKLTDFVLTLVGSLNILYNSKSLDIPLTIRLVHLELMKSDPSELKADLHDDQFMSKFCKFAAKKNTRGELWDHALLLTAHDLNFGGVSATQGVAYLGMMCINSLSCSLAEATNFNVALVLGHELMHSVGLEHDGDGGSHAAACSSNKYIMSPSTGGGKTTWSSCSSKKAKELLDSGMKNYLAKYGLPDCLESSSKSKSISYASKKLPGEKYPQKEQCRLTAGKSATPFTQGSQYSDVCHMLYCSIPYGGMYSAVSPTHPALEGTSCGSKKVCKAGICK